jgi:predicted permease
VSARTPRPPAAWSRLLGWAANRLGTPELADDAAELFAEHAASRGEGPARSWYRRQALSSLRRAILPGREGPRGRRTPTWVAGLSLDVKLGLRMLVKNRGLTAVAVFALALGIPTALWPFHFMNILATPLPFDEGEQILALRHSEGVMESGSGRPHAYSVWREELTSFEELGAARLANLNVVPEEGPVRPWRSAFMTASTFRIMRVPPLLGRPLLDADEVVGGADVVVLGYEPWQTLFGGDPGAVGRTIRIAGAPHTIVGVMPEGFGFPTNEHLWIPLRGIASAEPGVGPGVRIYGRLAEGVSESQALAEVTSVEVGLDEAFPDAYGSVRPEIIPYSYVGIGGPGPVGARLILGPFQLLALVLLGVACGNVGTLVLARNAARAGEIAVRTALGASRARIVSQLFVESLVLALVATGVGLALGHWVTERLGQIPRNDMPFWIDIGLSRKTALYALGLAVFCASVAGILPALKSTSGSVQKRMQSSNTGGGPVRFGGATTALVVAEVALGVLCLFGGWVGWRMIPRVEPAHAEIALDSFLAASLTSVGTLESEPGSEPVDRDLRTAEIQQELARRLLGEPGVRGVAFASSLPGEGHDDVRLEVEGEPLADGGLGHQVQAASVVPGFFEGLGHPVRSGRDFTLSDVPASEEATAAPVIVNASLAARVFGGTNPIGRRVRYVTSGDEEPAPWHEIVGVVGSLGMSQDPASDGAGLYHPVAPSDLAPLRMAVHLSGDPAAFAPRLREILAEIDPAAMINEPMPLTEVNADDAKLMGWMLFAVAVVAGISVLLSVASLNALMAFTVAQRTREIGLRSALGAEAGRIVSVIAGRAFAQLAVGVLLAVAASAVIVTKGLPADPATAGWPLALAGAAAIVLLVGMLACVGPTLRGLRIRPVEALKS